MLSRPALVRLCLIRDSLADLPVYPVPAGFSVRFHRPGDALTWTRIQREAEPYHEVTPELFERAFGRSEEQLADRQMFLCDPDGREIGTGSAWFDDDYHGGAWGRIHWVAIMPAWQGRGLGRSLLSILCRRLAALGHARAYLATESVRLHALRLYLRFGFRPDICSEAERREWAALRALNLIGDNFTLGS